MKTKLTLTLNKEIIEQAKSHTKDNDMSLFELIETYLASLTKRAEVSPLGESLTGVIPDENCNYKKKPVITFLKNTSSVNSLPI